MKKLSIHIVTFNSRQFIEYCLDSVFKSDFKDYQVFLVDNDSCDKTADFVNKNYLKEKKEQKLFVIRNRINKGFSTAHNQIISMTNSKYVLVLNPDTILKPDFLKKLIGFIEKNRNLGAVTGKLLKAKLEDFELKQVKKTNIIDSTGLKVLKSHRTIDRGEGLKDDATIKTGSVFGVSGACALYRRKALEDTRLPVNNSFEYFDEDFFAYKEDIDLSWRMRLFGWDIKYFSEAIAYHFRSGAPVNKRFAKPDLIQKLSYRNHLWMLLKNSLLLCFMSRIFHILWYEICKKFYLFFTHPILFFKSINSFLGGFKKMRKKREYIMEHKKLGVDDICHWFNN